LLTISLGKGCPKTFLAARSNGRPKGRLLLNDISKTPQNGAGFSDFYLKTSTIPLNWRMHEGRFRGQVSPCFIFVNRNWYHFAKPNKKWQYIPIELAKMAI